jgi:two-component system response regulator VicR
MSKGKILIVEDDRDIAEMVEYNLREEGYETLSAFNGEDGVELATKEGPDLIILDSPFARAWGYGTGSGNSKAHCHGS